jgi:hypothetical protein
MTSAHAATSNVRVQFTVGALHVLLGVALALFMRHYMNHWYLSFMLAPKWYQSYWLPLWVACVTYAFEAAFVRLPAEWLYGLMITAPPYGWLAGLATVVYLEKGTAGEFSEFAKFALPALLLAFSGAVLDPVISGLVFRLRNRR